MAAGLRVLIDDQAFMYLPRSGMARYFAEVIGQLRARPEWGIQPVTPYRYVRSQHLSEVDSLNFTATEIAHRRLRGRGARALRLLNRARVRPPGPVDLVHHTFYAPAALDRYDTRVRVCTIFDMIPELFPDPIMMLQAREKRKYRDVCDGFICISETSRDDFLRIYGDPGRPMVVTPLAVSPTFLSSAASSAPFDTPYVLYVGQRGMYKNFGVLLEAFAAVAAAGAVHGGATLVCVGGPPLGPAERAKAAELGVAGRVRQVALDDQALAAAYRHAACFVFPSKIEGFGLPVLEALASGCPVLLADTPIFREIGADVVSYFPPDDVSSLAEILAKVLGDRATSSVKAVRGKLRARDYTWERTARLTATFYRDVMAS